jgi:poly(3-hydroxybutyrate) depolymerase
MKRIIAFCLVLFLMNILLIKAAKLVDTSFFSGNVKYKLFMSIPEDYNASKKYSLVIGLQGCSGTSAITYFNGLKPITDSLKMIVVCPNVNGNYIADNQWNIVKASIDSAKAIYNIDTTSVFLTGWSCNAEVALHQGLKKLYPFKGIFPWEPSGFVFDSNTNLKTDMPITIAEGTSDDSYRAVLMIYDSLKAKGAKVNLVLVPGKTHQIDFASFGNEMIHSIQYLNYTNTISIEYSETSFPEINMMNTDAAKELVFKVKNKGKKELIFSSFCTYTYMINNPTIKYSAIDSTVKLTFMPNAGMYGKILIGLEAREKDGVAIEQFTFYVKVSKAVSVKSAQSSVGVLEFSPNPAKDKIYIQNNEQNLNIQIIDISGRAVLRKSVTGAGPIDISNLKNGIYFIQVKGKMVYPTEKLIKE